MASPELPRIELDDLERVSIKRESHVVAGIAAHPQLDAAHVVPVGPDAQAIRRVVALPARNPGWSREYAPRLMPVVRVVAVELHCRRLRVRHYRF